MKNQEIMTEIWKDIPGYEGLYQISNYWRIKSANGILKQRKDKYGYLIIGLCSHQKHKTFKVHRLVAQAFIPNPQNLPCINHKDEDKTNNFIYINDDGTVNEELSNLEWCGWSYNHDYGTRNQRVSDSMTNGKKSKPVLQYTLEGEFVKEYPSTREVERLTGIYQTHVGECCRGIAKTAGGYIWKYKNGS